MVDDERTIPFMLSRALGGDYAIEHVSDPAVIAALPDSPTPDQHDVIVLDVGLAELSGLDVLAALRAAGCLTAVVMLTADQSSATATTALRGGAFHYLTKPVNLAAAREVIDLAARHTRLTRELARPGGGATTSPIVGGSPAMSRLRSRLSQVGRADVSVLITGESGTGKELVARALHDASTRRDRRFVAINCGAIPAELIDSELFGHTRGAFTGAVTARAGVFGEADRGTLFLDEIGDMPMPVQARLLRVLQEGEVRAVGAEGTQHVDVRVIAATHVDLAGEVQRGRFRADLYFRLNVVNVHVPPLRERADDVPSLIAALLLRHAGPNPPTIDGEALEAMTAYGWPGNVRELENALRHALAMRGQGPIGLGDLPTAIAAARRPAVMPLGSGPIPLDVDAPLTEAKRRAVAEFEKAYLLRVLEQAGSITAAARAAGVDRTNFRRLLQRHGIGAAHWKS